MCVLDGIMEPSEHGQTASGCQNENQPKASVDRNVFMLARNILALEKLVVFADVC